MTSRRCTCLIPARGGSKGIPNKNLVDLCGKPLIAYTIDAAIECGIFERIMVSTDSPDIAIVSEAFGADVPFLRPEILATDSAGATAVIDHALDYLEQSGDSADVIAYLQPTSPLRTAADLVDAWQLFLDSSADTLVSVEKVPHRFTPESVMHIGDDASLSLHQDGVPLLDRHQKPAYVGRNGPAILLLDVAAYRIAGGFYSDTQKVVGFMMPAIRSIDIDEPDDLLMAGALLTQQTV